MTVQMRRYRLKEGTREAFQKVFLEVIVPLRQATGFKVLGAYWIGEREFFMVRGPRGLRGGGRGLLQPPGEAKGRPQPVPGGGGNPLGGEASLGNSPSL